MRCANDSVALPVAYLLALLNVARSIAYRLAIGDLPTPVACAQMPFASGFLASKVSVQIAASRLVRINMQILILVTPD